MRLSKVAVVLTAFGMAGCGAAHPAAAGHGKTPSAVAAVAHPNTSPPWSTRAASWRLARQLIGADVLPPGARRLPQRPLPPGLAQVSEAVGVTNSIDLYRLFALPMPMQQAARFLALHAPAGMAPGGTGQASGPQGVTEMDVSYFVNKPPWGTSSAGLVDTVAPGPRGGALLRVDVQVAWYPRRSAAEYLAPGDFQAVTIDGTLYGPSVRQITRTYTARGVIGRLTRLLDSLPAFPGGVYHCPLELASYQLTFTGVSGHPNVVVQAANCAADSVSVGGAAQPALADFGKVTRLVSKILQVRPRP